MKRVLMMVAALLFCGPGGALSGDGAPEGPSFDVYGFARFETAYFTQEIVRGDWMLFAAPDEVYTEDQSVLTMTARHSRLGLNWSDGGGEAAVVSGKIEFDFAGGFAGYSTAARAAHVMLRHAWGQYARGDWALRFGQDWALISTPFPGTTDFTIGGDKGNLWMRYPQIKFMQEFESGAKYALSLNRPMAGNRGYPGRDLDPIGEGEYTAIPWVMGRLWVPAGPAVVSVSGHFGQEQIDDGAGVPHDTNTYSIHGDIVLKKGAFSLSGRGFYGENLDSFLGGIGQGFTVGPDRVDNIAAVGGWAQVGFKLSPTHSIVAGGGMDDPDEKDLTPGMRDRNDWLFATFSCNVAKGFSAHVGVDYLQTSYMDNYPLVLDGEGHAQDLDGDGKWDRDSGAELVEIDPGSTIRISFMTVHKF